MLYMATLPSSPPLPPESASSSSLPKKTRKVTRLRSLATKPGGMERPMVHVNPAIGKDDGPHKKKLRMYFGIVARDKVNFKYDLTSKWALAQGKEEDDDTIFEKYGINKEKVGETLHERKKALTIQKLNTVPHVLSRGGYDLLEEKLMKEKQKKRLEHVSQFESTKTIWKMTRTKKFGEMTFEAAREIADRIDSLEARSTQGKHSDRVHVVGVDVMIKQYFGPASKSSRTSTFMALEDQEQLTQKIRDQLEESIIEKVTQQLMLSFNQIQSQGLALPPEPEVDPFIASVNTKGSYVSWDATVFGVYNDNFPLYITLEDLCEIAHNGQCLSIFCNKQKGSTECDYYYFSDLRLLKLERLKSIRI
ncbi:hypothetical protein HKD37_07G020131 [Glycine soja]